MTIRKRTPALQYTNWKYATCLIFQLGAPLRFRSLFSHTLMVQSTHQRFSTNTPFILLLLTLVFVAAVRWRLLDVPLERDEGEYAYMAQLFLDGVPLYAEAYNMKFPGIYLWYALVMSLFGQSITSIHLGLLFVNLLTIVLIFLLVRTLLDAWTGAIAAAMYGVLTLSYHVDAFWANAEHFVLPFGIGGLLLLLHALKSKRLIHFFAAGSVLACAGLVKQHGTVYGMVGVIVLIQSMMQEKEIAWRERAGRLIFFFTGAFAPILLVFLYLVGSGVMERFIFWTFTYARAYGSQISLHEAPHYFLSTFLPLAKNTILIWLLAAAGLASLLVSERMRRWRTFIIVLCIFSFLATTPGFYFRSHYLVFLLPAAALLGGFGTRWLFDVFSKAAYPALRVAPPLIVLLLALTTGITSHSDVLFVHPPHHVTRITYGGNPFPESLLIAQFVEQRTDPTDRIGIIGSEPQIFFYSKRRSASGYMYMYPMLEEQPYALTMQQDMVRQIEAARPKLMLYFNVRPSLAERRPAQEYIFDWFKSYVETHYRLIARLEYTPGAQSLVFLTDPDSLTAPPQQVYWVTFYERTSPIP